MSQCKLPAPMQDWTAHKKRRPLPFRNMPRLISLNLLLAFIESHVLMKACRLLFSRTHLTQAFLKGALWKADAFISMTFLSFLPLIWQATGILGMRPALFWSAHLVKASPSRPAFSYLPPLTSAKAKISFFASWKSLREKSKANAVHCPLLNEKMSQAGPFHRG